MKVLKLVKRGFLGFITCIVLFYSWFYLSAKKPQAITSIPNEVRERIQKAIDYKCERDGENSGLNHCNYGISFDIYKDEYYLNNKVKLKEDQTGNIEYLTGSIMILSSSYSKGMFITFWRDLLLPSHTIIQIRKTQDLSLVHSFMIWKGGNGFVPYKNELYYICGEDYANAHNKDIMTLPASEFCVADMGQSFE